MLAPTCAPLGAHVTHVTWSLLMAAQLMPSAWPCRTSITCRQHRASIIYGSQCDHYRGWHAVLGRDQRAQKDRWARDALSALCRGIVCPLCMCSLVLLRNPEAKNLCKHEVRRLGGSWLQHGRIPCLCQHEVRKPLTAWDRKPTSFVATSHTLAVQSFAQVTARSAPPSC